MADFRKWLPVLALVALMLGSMSTASAQTAFSCSATTGAVTPIIRGEGITELVGDIVLQCTGGTPAADPAAVPQVNIQIFLNTQITSRLLDSNGTTEATLMIDDPAVGARQLGPIPGVVPAGGNNVYLSRRVAENAIAFLGIPVDAPGTTGTRILRITNLRANASGIGVSTTFIQNQAIAFISISGATTIPVNPAQLPVAFVSRGLDFSLSGSALGFRQCVGVNKNLTSPNPDQNGTINAWLEFEEGFPTAFKVRGAMTGSAIVQDVIGTNYNTESGFTLGGLNASAGIANTGTRLMARFNGLPAGVTAYVTTTNTNTYPTLVASYVSGTDLNGAGGFPDPSGIIKAGTAGGFDLVQVNTVNGAGMAVWEVTGVGLQSNSTLESLTFGVVFAYTPNYANNMPALGTGSVTGSFAPLSVVTSASQNQPIPRFVGPGTSRDIIKISACVTNLLFPFVTNQAGFDTGIAISNTSQDPFSSANAQGGTCVLNFYGGTTAAPGTNPPAQTSQTINAGQQLVMSLSAGGNLGTGPVAGFQGYIIAQCNFLYAHGYAFISDVGAQRLAQGYLALVMGPGGEYRGLAAAEALNQ
ncbi:MAG: hypothetical protein LC130_14225 [Bryobacterales bacterium]|nr:hypothetical protein [Bryobacterales bacterium]MEB2363251.1 hypothetical protein [Bryobacterales bacterium]